jgi:hypothetical protein
MKPCSKSRDMAPAAAGPSRVRSVAAAPLSLWKAELSGAADSRLSSEVLASLRREFEEAHACFSADAFEATVVMVRRLFEGACRENGAQERNLAEALLRLRKGLVDGTLAEWATALRLLGNDGAHYTGRPVSRDDAEDSLAFAEALLEHIYVLQKSFLKFAERRAINKR